MSHVCDSDKVTRTTLNTHEIFIAVIARVYVIDWRMGINKKTPKAGKRWNHYVWCSIDAHKSRIIFPALKFSFLISNKLHSWLICFLFLTFSGVFSLFYTARILCPFRSDLLWLSLHRLHPKLSVHTPSSQQCFRIIINNHFLKQDLIFAFSIWSDDTFMKSGRFTNELSIRPMPL